MITKISENAYFRSPIVFQNIVVSIYGLKYRKERYGSDYKKIFKKIMQSQRWDENQVRKYQEEELKTLLDYAKNNTQYYSRTIAKYVFKEIQDICKFPTINKNIVRERYSQFIDKNLDKDIYINIHTSGTTGTPLTIPVYKKARQANYAYFERAKRWAGVGENSRGVTFAGRVFVDPKASSPPFWRNNYFNNNLLCSSYHLSPQNLPHYYEKIKDFNPDFIDSYPSCAYVLAAFIKEEGLPKFKLRAVLTSSETLLEHQRDTIEESFGCKVYDQYGMAEQAAYICQCEQGEYHINSDYGLMEILDPGSDTPVSSGETGEIVCTGFTNRALPLIRYRTGDMAAFSEKPCGCGRKFPVVKSIVGRMDDILITPDGTKIGRLDPVFKGITQTIVETQIIQTDPDTLLVRMVRGARFSEDDCRKVIYELNKRTKYSFTIKTEFVDEIPRGKNGKFRSVISRLSETNANESTELFPQEGISRNDRH